MTLCVPVAPLFLVHPEGGGLRDNLHAYLAVSPLAPPTLARSLLATFTVVSRCANLRSRKLVAPRYLSSSLFLPLPLPPSLFLFLSLPIFSISLPLFVYSCKRSQFISSSLYIYRLTLLRRIIIKHNKNCIVIDTIIFFLHVRTIEILFDWFDTNSPLIRTLFADSRHSAWRDFVTKFLN